MDISAETFFGITVLLDTPEDEMLAMEKLGWRQTLTSSSTDLPQDFATSSRSLVSSGVGGETLSSERSAGVGEMVKSRGYVGQGEVQGTLRSESHVANPVIACAGYLADTAAKRSRGSSEIADTSGTLHKPLTETR